MSPCSAANACGALLLLSWSQAPLLVQDRQTRWLSVLPHHTALHVISECHSKCSIAAHVRFDWGDGTLCVLSTNHAPNLSFKVLSRLQGVFPRVCIIMPRESPKADSPPCAWQVALLEHSFLHRVPAKQCLPYA